MSDIKENENNQVVDQSFLDKKYFIDDSTYNCPFCNRNNVRYMIVGEDSFDWSNRKKCYVYRVLCTSCEKVSMHLSDEIISDKRFGPYGKRIYFNEGIDIDFKIFYSVPTSFFVLDSRIPKIIRELISEAEGSLKMNFLTGASACMRKAIYELLVKERVEGEYYGDKIKALKEKYPDTDPELFEILGHIQDMTSEKVHEQSWDKWDSNALRLFIETLKIILYEIYVQPKEKKVRYQFIRQLKEMVSKARIKKTSANDNRPPS